MIIQIRFCSHGAYLVLEVSHQHKHEKEATNPQAVHALKNTKQGEMTGDPGLG
jgi:hypothetical protein